MHSQFLHAADTGILGADDGRVYRVTKTGTLEPVASGLANPVGVAFVGGSLLVSDINGDFHVGTQKFPDGFMVSIKAK